MVSTAIPHRTGRSAWRKCALLFALPFALLFALLMAPLCADADPAPQVSRDAALPTWVKPQAVDLSPAAPGDQEGIAGSWDLLLDVQANAQESATYEHHATKFLSQNGVEDGSRVTIVFDPAYQTLTLNKLVVYRDGKPMDRLISQDVKLLQREEGLEQRLYDGRLSAVMLLEDIRVGDVLEYSYTIKGENPIFDGNFFDQFYVQQETPLHRFYHRLLWPAERHLSIKAFNGDFPPAVTKGAPFTEYVWEKNDIPALISDGDLPSSFDPYQWVQLSEFPAWSDVNAWALKLLALPDKTPASLVEQAAPLRAIADPKKRALEALRFVQKNIRYLGIEVGPHSHKPYPVDTVLERRFGDCKDKSLLLCALLRELGFQAYPALVDTETRQSLSEWLPTAVAFNHCVAQLQLGGRTYWLDATMNNEGGSLDDLYFSDLGYALVVKPGADSLTRIAPGGYDSLGMQTVETYEIKDKGDATLDVHTIYRGRNADSMRSILADQSRDEIQKNYLNHYARQYRNIRAAKAPVFSDDFEKDIITADLSYTISHIWQTRADDARTQYADFFPRSIRDVVNEPDTSVRTMPLDISYPKRVEQVFKITMPRPADVEPAQMTVTDPAFKYTSERTFDGSRVTLHYTYETRADHVDAARTGEYLEHLNKMLDDLDSEVGIGKQSVVDMDDSDITRDPVVASHAAPRATFWFWAVLLGAGAIFWIGNRIQAKKALLPENALHRCYLCGKTEHTAPEMEFRVARDGHEYCRLHLPKRS